MSQTITLDNFSGNILNQVNLTSDIVASVSALPAQNSSVFVAGVPVLLGNPGAATCELLTAAAPANSTTVSTTTPTKLPHNSDEDISLLFATSLRIYRASDQYGTGQQPDDANFSLIATVVIDPTQLETTYTDSAAGTYWYKYTFYNTTSTNETPLSDSIAMEAGQVHYVTLQQIRNSAGFSDAPQVTDSKISEFRDAAEKEINGRISSVINLPLTQPTNPIITQIAKNIAAGELMQDQFNTISPAMVQLGEAKAIEARAGSTYTSLEDIVERVVILQDANYNELTKDDPHGFSGYPDNTANQEDDSSDERRSFTINEEY